ncbi:hypothetical protein F1C10_14555 [Sphingomonas sp. NBWT7]|uniref:DUF6961 family protein n=1 Tax=Sphingomonas sp. NBWT7 TaxID=2596913 RepID=UPI001625F1B6|nr:hypothetical protein [Sphingomonas sp. NBWT7]QNE33018.1 hypothetical protein F1C10_14555 [Sphingomonas sp. NBWT7]
MTEDQERWAEALEIERQHGMLAPMWIAERTGALALAGDFAGVARFREIAAKHEQLLAAKAHA